MQNDFIDHSAAKRRCHQGDHRGHGTLCHKPPVGPPRPDGTATSGRGRAHVMHDRRELGDLETQHPGLRLDAIIIVH